MPYTGRLRVLYKKKTTSEGTVWLTGWACTAGKGEMGNLGAREGYLFQASGISKDSDFTSWSILKGKEICH